MTTAAGVVVFVSVHDVWHVGERKRLRLLMARAHPDRGGTLQAFDVAVHRFRAWVDAEQVSYTAIGLGLPVCASGDKYAPKPAGKLQRHPSETALCTICGASFAARLYGSGRVMTCGFACRYHAASLRNTGRSNPFRGRRTASPKGLPCPTSPSAATPPST